MSSEGHHSLIVWFTKAKKCSFTVNDQSAEMLTKPRLRSTEAEPGTFSSVRVFLANVHSEGSGTHSSFSSNTFRRAFRRRSLGVQSLFAWKWLEGRVAALSPDVFGSNYQVVGPNTAERFGCSRLMLRSISFASAICWQKTSTSTKPNGWTCPVTTVNISLLISLQYRHGVHYQG